MDHFILADTFRYRSKTFQDRSKLRNAQGGHWITIPLFGHPEGAPIHTIEIKTGGRWQEKHWRSFMYDYRTTMYFEFYEDRFKPFFEHEWENLADCTCRSVELQADLYGLDTDITRASTLDGPADSLAEIYELVGGEETLVLSEDQASSEDVQSVEVFSYQSPNYRQNFEGFEGGMSGMDLLFNYGREAPRTLSKGIGAQDEPDTA